ncbi:MAG: hypothetical protein JWN48_1536 [Myxococcaceae bacterium]|nr:hypothetical protein [Myxococcaceae bacterium]
MHHRRRRDRYPLPAVCTLTLSAALLLGGCASLEQRSQGHIGCPAEAITISGVNNEMNPTRWTAACKGVKYFCSVQTLGRDASTVACAPVPPATAPAASTSGAEASGCQYDTQCKAERLCRDGRCVDP